MRKYTLWIVLALMLSLMIGTQLATGHMNASVVHAKVDIWPRSLCIHYDYCSDGCSGDSESFGEHESRYECGWTCTRRGWITALIRLPKEYDERDIDPSTVTLQVMGGTVPVSSYRVLSRRIFLARFDKATVIDLLCTMIQHMAPHVKQKVTFIVTGNLLDGKIFRGEDTVRVLILD
jgi:uncharacterized membrane protein